MAGKFEDASSGPGWRRMLAAAAMFTISGGALAGPIVAQCAAPPPVVKDISAEVFYVDRPRSLMNQHAVRRNVEALRRLDDGLTAIIAGADVAIEKSSEIAGRCSTMWLATWASQQAMLGQVQRPQAKYERKWRAAGMAIAYLKLRPYASESERRSIEDWLRSLARLVLMERESHDNQWNWVGLVQTAVGVATGDRAMFETGRAIYDRALGEIAPDGSLAAELQRAGRALHYHNFALAPLVMMAELASLRGEDWYARRDGAIHRLVGFAADGLMDPASFSQRAGAPVELPQGGILAWMTFYERRFPGRIGGPKPLEGYNYYWLGGQAKVTAKLWSAASAE